MTRDEFERTARPLMLDVMGVEVAAKPKVFASGRYGWSYNSVILVSGTRYRVTGNVVVEEGRLLAAVQRLRGKHNHIGLLELREAVNLSRDSFDHELLDLWRASRITLSGPERQLSDAERAAAIVHYGEQLYWVSLVD